MFQDLEKQQMKALEEFRRKYPSITSGDIQSFLFGFQACLDAIKSEQENKDKVDNILSKF